MFGLIIKEPKLLFVKVLIIFIPVFLVAHITENMVYVLPTLAAGLFIGGNMKDNSKVDVEETDTDVGE